MKTPGLIKNFDSASPVAPRRIMAMGASDGYAEQASSPSQRLIGVSQWGRSQAGRTDVVLSWIEEVDYGGTITRGQLLTTDADGKAVTAGDGDYSVGMAFVSGVAGDIGYVLINPSRVDVGSNLTASPAEINVLDNAPANCVFTIGSESSNIINVSVQLRNADNTNLATRRAVQCYLSGANTGATLATAPSGGVAIGTNGLLIEPVADRFFTAVTNASGVFDINITDTGTPTVYLVVVFPNGSIQVSNAITFA
ncbi:hypothetical protein [Synechococcus sp. PCC 6312]|uniref:hypothetical protein n=1 Tax=Synechococcus sp. (strain ATCC 27167 / PCC 6312) TaxID=195253 RepID=UPI00029EEAF6|nr:hypothetical protein [Synechococcus sp. PCC 6312]AFY60356.1 hypothetical protein Syn6312_1171 [Synechococcus sp. PCC 6312]